MSTRFNFIQTPLSRVYIAQRKSLNDIRGSFARLFCANEFQEIQLSKPIVQINHSVTRTKGSVRGLHLQIPPHAETKIITCIKGRIFDVVVDLRRDSKTFLSWHGEELSIKNQKSILIPEGCAHGFQALADDCELIYFHTQFYAPIKEKGFNVSDPQINIHWPLPITHISERDKNHDFIKKDFSGVIL